MKEQGWLECTDPLKMLDYLYAEKYDDPPQHDDGKKVSERKLRLFACACVRSQWHLLKDELFRRVLCIAEERADGKNWEPVLQKAIRQARKASSVLPIGPEKDAAQASAWVAPEKGISTERAVRGVLACIRRERPLQCHLLREIVGNPYSAAGLCGRRWAPPDSGAAHHACCDCTALRTPTVLAGARAIYAGHLWEEMPMLADALEDAGCANELVLRHLRDEQRCWLCEQTNSDPEKDACSVCGQLGAVGPYGHPVAPGWVPLPHPHARGCWALDLILGKSRT